MQEKQKTVSQTPDPASEQAEKTEIFGQPETMEGPAEAANETAAAPAEDETESLEMLREDNVTRLEYEGKEIILIATAHVSRQSVELVKRVIDEEQPDSICIELDEDRYKNIQDPDAWKNTDIVQVIKAKKVGFLFANLLLSSYQKKMAEKLGTNVGQEMMQGIESAREIGANLVLADRRIQITFMRIWHMLSLWSKIKLIFQLLFSFEDDGDSEMTEDDLQNLLQEDMLESALAEIRDEFPAIGQVLIDERDQYLANKIKNAPGKKIVAILGGAHVPGIKSEIDQEQDMEGIVQVPKAKPIARIIAWTIPIVIIALIAYGFIQNFQTGLSGLSKWFIWNSGLAGLFTALTLAHPASILTAFVLAPFTSLNPFVACGWFAGLVEASIRKPTVEDIENVPLDIFSFRRIVKNRFLKIILVVFMANIGSSIGTFVAGLDLIQNLLR